MTVVVFAAGLLSACTTSSDQRSLRPSDPVSAVSADEQSGAGIDAEATGTLATVVPSKKFADLAYAKRSASEKLDLYLPTTGNGPFPVVLWIHGGGWWAGDKALPPNASQFALLSSGFAVAAVNYRLSQEAIFPAQIQDLKAAVRWLRANAQTYGLDTARFGAWGTSAGGHLTSMLGTSAGVAALSDPTLGNATYSDRIKAAVDFFGPMAFRAMDAQLLANGCPLFGGIGHSSGQSQTSHLVGAPINTVPLKVSQADPTSYVTTGDAAFMIQHGTGDCAVPYQQAVTLQKSLVPKIGSTRVSFQLMPGYTHADPRYMTAANVAKVAAFLKAWM